MNEAIQYLAPVWAWCLDHPEIVVPAIVYVAYNVIPRTPPTNPQLFALWSLAERAMVLSWDRWGGFVKALGFVSPDPAAWSKEQPTKPDVPRLTP